MGSFNKEALKFLNENSIFIAPDIPEKKQWAQSMRMLLIQNTITSLF